MRWVVRFAVVALGASGVIPPVSASAQDGVERTMLVTYRSDAALGIAAAAGGSLHHADAGAAAVAGRVAVAELTPAQAAAVAADPSVLAVEEPLWATAADVPDDPCYVTPATCPPSGAWHVDRMELTGAWDVSHGGAVVIGLIDGGLDEQHPVPDLVGRITREIDVTGGQPECTSHATHAASLAAAATDNGVRIPGAGWNLRILSVQALHSAGSGCGGSEANVISGISNALAAGARIINLSLTVPGLSTAMRASIDDAIARGAVVVAAAGNSGSSSPSVGDGGYPAAYEPVLAVGATTSSDRRASFSNFGSWVDVYAPGAALADTQTSTNLLGISGTSFAAPLVSGVVALMRAVRPSISPAGVDVVVGRTVDVVNGLPRLDARMALYDNLFHDYVWPGPSALAAGASNVRVASRTVNGTIAHRVLGGRWSDAGGGFIGDPDLASAGAGRIDVVGRGLDNRAWYRRLDIASAWVPLGTGQFNSSLTLTSPSPGRVDVFGRGLDGALWHGLLTASGFSGWFPLGGSLASSPDAASLGDGRMVVYAVGADGAMWGRIFDDGWSPWFTLGGGFSSGPGAAWSTGRLDVVARGLDGAVWQRTFSGTSWSAWTSLGGFVVSAPDLATRAAGSLDVLARAGDGLVWRRTFGAGAWGPWFPTE